MKNLNTILTSYISFEIIVLNGGRRVGVKRCCLDNLNIYYPIYYNYDKFKNVYFWDSYTNRKYETISIAMTEFDKVLINKGYILLTEEEWEKYSILL